MGLWDGRHPSKSRTYTPGLNQQKVKLPYVLGLIFPPKLVMAFTKLVLSVATSLQAMMVNK